MNCYLITYRQSSHIHKEHKYDKTINDAGKHGAKYVMENTLHL
jgi:hypothetical protein